MSIFDVIKYPISEPPKVSELKALPPEIFNEWMLPFTSAVGIKLTPEIFEQVYLSENSPTKNGVCSDNFKLHIARLRSLIKQYEPPNN